MPDTSFKVEVNGKIERVDLGHPPTPEEVQQAYDQIASSRTIQPMSTGRVGSNPSRMGGNPSDALNSIGSLKGQFSQQFPGSRSEQYSGQPRMIQGTNTPSLHNNGLALDLYDKDLQSVADWALQQPGIKTVIYNRQIWSPGRGWRPYTKGDPHTTHVHVDYGGVAVDVPKQPQQAPQQTPGAQTVLNAAMGMNPLAAAKALQKTQPQQKRVTPPRSIASTNSTYNQGSRLAASLGIATPPVPRDNGEDNSESRARLIRAIKDVEAAGYKVNHGIGTKNEPEGDVGPSNDVKALIGGLTQQLKGTKDPAKRKILQGKIDYWKAESKQNGVTQQDLDKINDVRYREFPATPNLDAATGKMFKKGFEQADISTIPANKAVAKVNAEKTRQARAEALKHNQGFETEKGIPDPNQAGHKRVFRGIEQGDLADFNSPEKQAQLAADIEAEHQKWLNAHPRNRSDFERAALGAADATERLAKGFHSIINNVFPGLNLPDVGLDIPDLVSRAITTPVHLAAEGVALGDPNAPIGTKAGAAANLGLAGFPIFEEMLSPITSGLRKLWDAGDTQGFNKALDALSLEPNQKAAIVQKIKQTPGMTLKGFENGKPRVQVKTPLGELTDAAKPLKQETSKTQMGFAQEKQATRDKIQVLRDSLPVAIDQVSDPKLRVRHNATLDEILKLEKNTTLTEARAVKAVTEAKTGKPFSGIGFRSGEGHNPEIGKFHAGTETGTTVFEVFGQKGETRAYDLNFKNPIVIGTRADLAKALKSPEMAQHLDDFKTGRTETYMAYDKAAAKAAREAGYDGIIYKKEGLGVGGADDIELVDLGKSPTQADYVTGPEGVTQKTSTRTSKITEEDLGVGAKIAQPAQGVSHAAIKDLREELGWRPSEKTTKTDAQLFQDAQKYKGKEATLADQVLSERSGTLSDEVQVALGVRLKNLKDEMTAARKADDFTTFDLADTEAQKIADALDHSGSNQGRAFRARRFLLEDNFDEWSFRRRIAKANDDLPLAPKRQKELENQLSELEKTNKTLTAERDAAIKKLDLGLRSSPRSGPRTVTQSRSDALHALKRLGVPVADVPDLVGAGMRSKQSGAIALPPVGKAMDQVAMNVRKLVRSYANEGLNGWPDVLKRLQKDIPGIEEDQALYILSGEYKQAKLAADVQKIKATEFSNAVRSEAQFRSKPAALKLLSYGADVLNTSQRSLQTTLDNSMALIQGKNVLTWKPGTWFKGVGDSIKAFTTKDPIGFARKHQADIENNILYPEARQAKLAISSIDGPLNRQEEFFAGRLENHIPGLSHSKAAATVMMNKMRFDLFRKMAANAPKDPQIRALYLQDIAQQINIATGKGTGRLAEALGGKLGGTIAYAPRYTISKWQHNFLAPIYLAKTGAGRREALKMYATQAAMYGGLLKAAQLFGGKVDLDPRSTDFGTVEFGDGHTYDLFRQQTEGFRTLFQLIYGRTSKSGNYKAPGEWGAYSIGDYLESKGSALARTFKMVSTGTTYDDTKGETRTVEGSDFWKSYIPLSIREMLKNKDPHTFIPSFFGGNVDVAKPKGEVKSPPPPLKGLPPGLNRILNGDPKEKAKKEEEAKAKAYANG